MSGGLPGIPALAFLIGSIPFGLLLTRAAGLGDIRKVGSGNIGATNVLRTGRRGLAALTLLLDILKGTAAVVLAGFLSTRPLAAALAALCVVLGHCFPPWLRFAGGKGVATLLGCALGLDWRVGVLCLLAWLLLARTTRFSSVGGIGAALALPLLLLAFHSPLPVLIAGLLACLLVVVRHYGNIARLRAGLEPRIGERVRPAGPPR